MAAPRTAAPDDPKNWGADAIFRIIDGKMVFQSYYKLSGAADAVENCVAHNGSLIPIPGRTIMVQAWYQGGLSIFEWTDPKHPHELGVLRPRPERLRRARSAAASGRCTGTTARSSDRKCSEVSMFST